MQKGGSLNPYLPRACFIKFASELRMINDLSMLVEYPIVTTP